MHGWAMAQRPAHARCTLPQVLRHIPQTGQPAKALSLQLQPMPGPPAPTLVDRSATPMGPSPPTRLRMQRCMAEAVEPRPVGDTSRTMTAAGARQHSLHDSRVGAWGRGR